LILAILILSGGRKRGKINEYANVGSGGNREKRKRKGVAATYRSRFIRRGKGGEKRKGQGHQNWGKKGKKSESRAFSRRDKKKKGRLAQERKGKKDDGLIQINPEKKKKKGEAHFPDQEGGRRKGRGKAIGFSCRLSRKKEKRKEIVSKV